MIHTSQTVIVSKLDDKFSSLKSQFDTLHQRFEQQDQVFREIASGSISRSELQGVESKINSVAAQADTRFEEFTSELESMKSTLEFFRVDNMRLKQRLNDLEEKASLGEIKSRRFFLSIDGLLEDKDKDQRTLVLEKLNSDANVNLCEGEILSAKRVGKIYYGLLRSEMKLPVIKYLKLEEICHLKLLILPFGSMKKYPKHIVVAKPCCGTW